MKRKKVGTAARARARSSAKKPAARVSSKKKSPPLAGGGRAGKASSGRARKKAPVVRASKTSMKANADRKYSQPGAPWWKAYL